VEISVRLATIVDLPDLLALDLECFPKGNTDLEPAPPGEIEQGVADDSIFVAVTAAQTIGMLQVEHSSSNEWELLSVAITSSHRSSGVGQALMDQLLIELNKSPYLVAVTCLTSPNNLAMQGLLEKYGFLQVGMALDHFGPGKHRLRFQLN
jgi:ribosomal protein S18 acetylase RimI-like enzyme